VFSDLIANGRSLAAVESNLEDSVSFRDCVSKVSFGPIHQNEIHNNNQL
jgi:hypothetical protein